MNDYELRNGLVLVRCEYWESPGSCGGSWFQKQFDDDEKATGCSLEEGCQWRHEGRMWRYLFSWLLVFCIPLCNHDVLICVVLPKL
jgi:hypothetical protein